MLNWLRRLYYRITFRKIPASISGESGSVFARIADVATRTKETEGKIIAAADSIKVKTDQAVKLMKDVEKLHIDHDLLDSIHDDIDKLLGK